MHTEISQLFRVKEELYDVEKLNEFSLQGKFDVTKLSFFAFFHALDNYVLLNSGSALGRGCGPLLIQKKGAKTKGLKNSKILVPGLKTTANLLLHLNLKEDFQPVAVRYDLVIPGLLTGEYDYGVIIHEERFTYEEKGLEQVVDLGEWWEEETGKPIPLGAISIKRDLAGEYKNEFDNKLRKSLELAYQYPEKTKDYIKKNSQSIEDDVIQKHIDLYVNQFTMDIGKEGKEAVQLLYEKAIRTGLINEKKELNLF